ncbi:unnamed protein product, partial [marine sediment metagenome]
ASSLNTTRLYQITLFFLAPFCVIGGITTFNKIMKLSGKRLGEESTKDSLKLLSIFFAIFLLFTSGFIYQIAKDIPSSISLDKTIDYPRFNDKEVHSAKWLGGIKDSYPIYADHFGMLLLSEFAFYRVRPFFNETKELPYGSYIYFRSINMKGFMTELYRYQHEKKMFYNVDLINSTFYNNVITKKNMVYDNGGSKIYH